MVVHLYPMPCEVLSVNVNYYVWPRALFAPIIQAPSTLLKRTFIVGSSLMMVILEPTMIGYHYRFVGSDNRHR